MMRNFGFRFFLSVTGFFQVFPQQSSIGWYYGLAHKAFSLCLVLYRYLCMLQNHFTCYPKQGSMLIRGPVNSRGFASLASGLDRAQGKHSEG